MQVVQESRAKSRQLAMLRDIVLSTTGDTIGPTDAKDADCGAALASGGGAAATVSLAKQRQAQRVETNLQDLSRQRARLFELFGSEKRRIQLQASGVEGTTESFAGG